MAWASIASNFFHHGHLFSLAALLTQRHQGQLAYIDIIYDRYHTRLLPSNLLFARHTYLYRQRLQRVITVRRTRPFVSLFSSQEGSRWCFARMETTVFACGGSSNSRPRIVMPKMEADLPESVRNPPTMFRVPCLPVIASVGESQARASTWSHPAPFSSVLALDPEVAHYDRRDER